MDMLVFVAYKTDLLCVAVSELDSNCELVLELV